MTKYEKALAAMTPAQREKVKKGVGDMMGMPSKSKTTKKSTKKKG